MRISVLVGLTDKDEVEVLVQPSEGVAKQLDELKDANVKGTHTRFRYLAILEAKRWSRRLETPVEVKARQAKQAKYDAEAKAQREAAESASKSEAKTEPNTMKTKVAVIAACLIGLAGNINAATTWNAARGMGNKSDGWTFTGAGTPLAVVQSVQSNSVYYITSAQSSGEPVFEDTWLQNDFVSGTLRFYTATNKWMLASNEALATNIVFLTTTNAGLATNDLLVYRDVANDSYQLVILSGNATDAAGLVYTNSLGQCAVKVFNTFSNAPAAGDELYKLALVQSFTPLGMGVITNQVDAVPSDHFGQWVRFGSDRVPITFSGRIGWPSAAVMTYSNAAALQVKGSYFVRQRR